MQKPGPTRLRPVDCGLGPKTFSPSAGLGRWGPRRVRARVLEPARVRRAQRGREIWGKMRFPSRWLRAGLGGVGAVQYNQSFLEAGSDFFSSEGVDILPVKPNLKANYGPHQYLCSPQGSSPVKTSTFPSPAFCGPSAAAWRGWRLLMLCWCSPPARPWPSSRRPSIQIRVIGNRRIPKETILARLFTHPATPTTRSRSSATSTRCGTRVLRDLRIEREDSEKGIILNIFVGRSPPSARSTTRASTPSRSRTCWTASRRKRSALGGEPVRPDQDQARRDGAQGSCWPSTATSSPPSRPRSRRFLRPRCR
jgi:hypothetical protein